MRQGFEQCSGAVMQPQRIAAQERQRPRHAALARLRRLAQGRILRAALGRLRGGENHITRRQRPQHQLAAARLDGGKHARGRVADQQKQRARRRLLQNLEQRVGGVGVEFVHRIDDADPPAGDGGGRTEKRNRLARFIDGDDAPHHPFVVGGALQRQQAAMAARHHLPRHRMIGIEVEAGRALHRRQRRLGIGEHELRHAVGQRRLADALRAADQPGMRNLAALVGTQQRRLCRRMAVEPRGLARRRHHGVALGLARAHARTVWLASLLSRRSCTTAQIRAATVSASALASISTQRCGSSVASC